jgi:2-pyrone-4,6-dicarboxylate lactonase
MEFHKTPGWLDWYTDPSKPRFAVPAGAVDAHCHVFGPSAEFHYAPEYKFTPCRGSKQHLFVVCTHPDLTTDAHVQAIRRPANYFVTDVIGHWRRLHAPRQPGKCESYNPWKHCLTEKLLATTSLTTTS